MKIALTCAATILPTEFGGSEKTVGYRAAALDKLGHDVTLFSCGPYKPPHGRQIQWTGDAKEIPVDEFDVIDNNGPTEFDCDHVINTIQGPFYPKKNVVTISDSQGKGMRFPSYKVVLYGIDTDFFTYREEKEDWFLFYSRIAHGKGPHIAIDLAKKMGFKLKIVGESKAYVEPIYAAQMEESVKGWDNIEWVGPRYMNSKPHNNVWYLQRAKALLFPQFWGEAFGLVMIEALSCGTPVIAGGRNGAPPEVIVPGVSGYLCNDIDDPYNDFVDAINNIDKISPRECRTEAEIRWSQKRMALDYIKLYKQIMAGFHW